MTAAEVPARRRVTLTGISSRAWEHPADRGALVALRELRGFDDVVRVLLRHVERTRLPPVRALQRHPGRPPAVPAGAPDLRRGRGDPRRGRPCPSSTSTQSPHLNAQAVGLDKPFIVVNSACVQQLDDAELRCLLGHELGHVGSGHALYKTILMIVSGWAANLSWLPVGALALRGIIAAMMEWWRKAELSADRAGLLAGQDPAAVAAAADEARRRRRPSARSTPPPSSSRPPSTPAAATCATACTRSG